MLLTCDSYLLDDQALSLQPVFIGKNKSKIIRIDGIYFSEESQNSLLEKACLRHGSTKQGRVDAVKEKMNYKHRTPLMIIPYTVGAFPTVSSEDLSCIWIFNHPVKIEELEKGKSRMTLLNGEEMIIPVSKHSLSNQKNKLYAALHVFEKLQTTERSGYSYGFYTGEGGQSRNKGETRGQEKSMKIAETKMSYHWIKKEKK